MMIGEELTAIIGRLDYLKEQLERLEHKRDLSQIIASLHAVRGKAFGRFLVDPAKMEIARREAGVR